MKEFIPNNLCEKHEISPDGTKDFLRGYLESLGFNFDKPMISHWDHERQGFWYEQREDTINRPEHSDMVRGLAKPGSEMIAQMTPEKAHLLHMVLGMAGEVGEIVDTVKKFCVYGGRGLDTSNLVEELGDLEFYLEGFRQGIGVTREDTIESNIDKLGKRYRGWQYSDEQAHLRRDKV